jgi:hypothetical protein
MLVLLCRKKSQQSFLLSASAFNFQPPPTTSKSILPVSTPAPTKFARNTLWGVTTTNITGILQRGSEKQVKDHFIANTTRNKEHALGPFESREILCAPLIA